VPIQRASPPPAGHDGRVLDDDPALQKLLNTLRHRIKEGTYRPSSDPATTTWVLRRLTAPVAELLAQIH
jgi:hypothetical protein